MSQGKGGNWAAQGTGGGCGAASDLEGGSGKVGVNPRLRRRTLTNLNLAPPTPAAILMGLEHPTSFSLCQGSAAYDEAAIHTMTLCLLSTQHQERAPTSSWEPSLPPLPCSGLLTFPTTGSQPNAAILNHPASKPCDDPASVEEAYSQCHTMWVGYAL
jgi:hypothetical protein